MGLNISIHAPREGSDVIDPLCDQIQEISIHAPREGSDDQPIGMDRQVGISIHAPREGSDQGAGPIPQGGDYFNPRSP